MPDRVSEPDFAQLHRSSGRKFEQKRVILTGRPEITPAGEVRIASGKASIQVTMPENLREEFVRAGVTPDEYRFEGTLTTLPESDSEYPHCLAVEKFEKVKRLTAFFF